jgi:uncharacterized protein Yka (UPF0111/DUF47 family)
MTIGGIIADSPNVARDALGNLLNGSNDAIYIIKWKDIYQLLEDASDRAEDIANVLEGIVLKHA